MKNVFMNYFKINSSNQMNYVFISFPLILMIVQFVSIAFLIFSHQSLYFMYHTNQHDSMRAITISSNFTLSENNNLQPKLKQTNSNEKLNKIDDVVNTQDDLSKINRTDKNLKAPLSENDNNQFQTVIEKPRFKQAFNPYNIKDYSSSTSIIKIKDSYPLIFQIVFSTIAIFGFASNYIYCQILMQRLSVPELVTIYNLAKVMHILGYMLYSFLLILGFDLQIFLDFYHLSLGLNYVSMVSSHLLTCLIIMMYFMTSCTYSFLSIYIIRELKSNLEKGKSITNEVTSKKEKNSEILLFINSLDELRISNYFSNHHDDYYYELKNKLSKYLGEEFSNSLVVKIYNFNILYRHKKSLIIDFIEKNKQEISSIVKLILTIFLVIFTIKFIILCEFFEFKKDQLSLLYEKYQNYQKKKEIGNNCYIYTNLCFIITWLLNLFYFNDLKYVNSHLAKELKEPKSVDEKYKKSFSLDKILVFADNSNTNVVSNSDNSNNHNPTIKNSIIGSITNIKNEHYKNKNECKDSKFEDFNSVFEYDNQIIDTKKEHGNKRKNQQNENTESCEVFENFLLDDSFSF